MDTGIDGGDAAFGRASGVCGDLPVRSIGDDFCFLGIDVAGEYVADPGSSHVGGGAVDFAAGAVGIYHKGH